MNSDISRSSAWWLVAGLAPVSLALSISCGSASIASGPTSRLSRVQAPASASPGVRVAPATAEPTSSRWSPEAIAEIERRQEASYKRVGTALHLGTDADLVYKRYAAGPIPAERLLPSRFKEAAAAYYSGDLDASADATAAAIRAFEDRYRNPPLPTRFEDAAPYGILLSISDQIEAAATRIPQFRRDLRILLASLPDGQVTGETVYLGRDVDYAILVHLGFMELMYAMARIVAIKFPPLVVDASGMHWAAPPWMDLDQSTVTSFGSVLARLVLTGIPKELPTLEVPPAHMFTAGLLLDSAETFALSHEHAHIYMRHLRATAVAGAAGAGAQSTWDREYDADDVGLSLAGGAADAQGVPIWLSYLGAPLYFESLKVLERCISVLRTGQDAEATRTDTHPPADLRLHNLEQALLDDARPDDGPPILQLSDVEGAIGTGRLLQLLLNRLADESVESWQRLHRSGQRPAAIWD